MHFIGCAAFAGTIVTNFVGGMAQYAIENSMSGRSVNWHDALANGGMQALSGAFAFVAGTIIGASGYYNVPGVTKMFTKEWFGNIAASQLIKGITYYPFSFVFSYLQRSFFYGDN